MTAAELQAERDLRALVKTEGSREAAQVLADFYADRGQITRAELWRTARHLGRHYQPADFFLGDLRWRRKVTMWLLSHVVSEETVARYFASSPRWTHVFVRQITRSICAAANVERHRPTAAATIRLQAAGALPTRFEPGVFELGEMPPDDWPATATHSRRRSR